MRSTEQRWPMARAAVLAVAGGLVAVLAMAGPAAAAAGSVAVSPTVVVAGGTVTFSGFVATSGTPSCPLPDGVTITSTAALFPPDGFGPTATRNSSGAFSVSYTVPASTPAGSYSIGLRCGGGNVGVSATLRVTSQVGQVPVGAPQAGLGGASTAGSSAAGWATAGAVATVLAGSLIFAITWRRRRAF